MHVLATFSIVACDLKAQAWGVAVASRFPAVGAVVPWARAKSGAVATQALANTSFGPRGLDLLDSRRSAYDALRELLAGDDDREHRQVGIVDNDGGAATFTGASCMEWAGGITGQGYAVQGNLLSGPEVVREMEHAFLETSGDLPKRLMTSLEAGGRAGGDRRGRQSAALLVVKPKAGYGGHNDRWIDYRVDDHLQPVSRLAELLDLHRLYYGKSPASQRVHLQGQTLVVLQEIMRNLGYYVPSNGEYDDATREAFRTFMANENFEQRANADEGWIDRPVLDHLLKSLK